MEDYGLEFKRDFIEKYSEKEFAEIEKMMDLFWDNNCQDDFDQEGYLWNLYVDTEKHSELQYTFYFHFYKEGEKYDEEVNLTFVDGINTGSEIIEYSLSVLLTKTLSDSLVLSESLDLVKSINRLFDQSLVLYENIVTNYMPYGLTEVALSDVLTLTEQFNFTIHILDFIIEIQYELYGIVTQLLESVGTIEIVYE